MAQTFDTDKGNKDAWLKEIYYGASIQTRGVGLKAGYAFRQPEEKHFKVFSLEFNTLRDQKEIRIRSANISTPGAYVFGKLNHAYVVRPGFGLRSSFSTKRYRGSIEMKWQAQAGPSLGILKPVYLDIIYRLPDNQGVYLMSERYQPSKHLNQNDIFGFSSFGRGLNEMALVPGIHAGASLICDFSYYSDLLKSVEIGANIDLFSKKLPIMANQQGQIFFTTAYICIAFGNRW